MKFNYLIFPIFLFLSSPIFAANQADLGVAGKITLSACSLNLSNGGVIDFGNIPVANLGEYGIQINGTDIEFTVDCVSPAKFALRFSDNRPQLPYNIFHCQNVIDRASCNYGLGNVNGVTIGAYSIHLQSNSVDYSYGIRSADNGSTWLSVASSSYSTSTEQWYTFTDGSVQVGGSYVPVGISTLAGSLSSIVAIKPIADLPPLDSAILLDGSTTIELIYL